MFLENILKPLARRAGTGLAGAVVALDAVNMTAAEADNLETAITVMILLVADLILSAKWGRK